ncbi:hypothetical protein AB0J38_20835 [Streptomyces sp. NPDC050095]|uniref:hypothetical protein n=1 Tax=unclassified Streptomyces TaxID=2593676 RepID=UPI00343AF6BD
MGLGACVERELAELAASGAKVLVSAMGEGGSGAWPMTRDVFLEFFREAGDVAAVELALERDATGLRLGTKDRAVTEAAWCADLSDAVRRDRRLESALRSALSFLYATRARGRTRAAWRCGHCDTFNRFSDGSCGICGAEAPAGERFLRVLAVDTAPDPGDAQGDARPAGVPAGVTGESTQRTVGGTVYTTTSTISGGTQQSVTQAAHIGTLNQHFGPVPDGVDWRPVHEVGPAEFGVRPTRRVPGLPDIPPYVPRDRDAELAERLTLNGLVLLLGKPVTGMSYTAWHAAHCLDGYQFYAPERGADLRALLGALRGSPGRYLLWLDDIEGHLGERGLEPGLLGRLTALGVRVLATMDADAYYERRTGSTPGDRVVGHAHTVELPRAWSDAEFARLAEQTEDPRAYEAYLWTDGNNPAAYLALGHLLYEEWQRLSARDADPDGVATVRAALDVARCGYAGAVPAELLRDLGASDLGEWAVQERIGNVGFLMPGPEPDTWRAHGALVAGELRTAKEPVSEERLWEMYEYTAPDSPEDRAVIETLAATLRPRAEAGDMEAAYELSGLLPFGPEAERLLRQAADAGMANAMSALGGSLLRHGRADEAVPYLEQAAAQGETWSALKLALHYRTRAEELFTGVAEKRPLHGLSLGDLIAGTPGRQAEAMRHYLAAWRAGNRLVGLRIAGVLHDWGDTDGAELWYRHAAAAGDPLAAYYLGVLLYNKRDHDTEAEELLTRAADAGHAKAATALGLLKERQGDAQAAYARYKEGDEGGDPAAPYRIGLLAADPDIRTTWLQRAADRGHYDAGLATGAFEPPAAPDTVEE